MYFILSKVLVFLLQPLFYVVTLLVLGLVFKRKIWARKCLWASLILLLFFSNRFILMEIVRWWEVPNERLDQMERYDCAILLSGMINGYDEKLDIINFHGGTDRLMQALLIQQRKVAKDLLMSGGSGDIRNPHHSESRLIRDYLKDIGYPMNHFFVDSISRNTHENAVESMKVLEERYGAGFKEKRYLLITSSIHMNRAVACFEKQGLKVDPYSTNRWSGPRKFHLEHLLIPAVGAMSGWRAIGHELVGYLTYKILGYA